MSKPPTPFCHNLARWDKVEFGWLCKCFRHYLEEDGSIDHEKNAEVTTHARQCYKDIRIHEEGLEIDDSHQGILNNPEAVNRRCKAMEAYATTRRAQMKGDLQKATERIDADRERKGLHDLNKMFASTFKSDPFPGQPPSSTGREHTREFVVAVKEYWEERERWDKANPPRAPLSEDEIEKKHYQNHYGDDWEAKY